jgi:uncharacterized membrane protein
VIRVTLLRRILASNVQIIVNPVVSRVFAILVRVVTNTTSQLTSAKNVRWMVVDGVALILSNAQYVRKGSY